LERERGHHAGWKGTAAEGIEAGADFRKVCQPISVGIRCLGIRAYNKFGIILDSVAIFVAIAYRGRQWDAMAKCLTFRARNKDDISFAVSCFLIDRLEI
jgi:hypothetical protein